MNDLVLVVPNGDNEKLQTMLRDVRAWSHEAEERIAENANALTAENCKAENLNAFDGEDKFLKAAADKLVDEVATVTHVKEMLVEISAARNRIKAAVKERNDKLRKLKEENLPKAKPRTFVVAIEATDAQFYAVAKGAVKCGANVVRYATAQSDKAVKSMQKWFEENE